ncbi:MAG: restriction endonuclease subunit S, partial [Alistipes sp.]|nr:restriction endonuclease subunit S [Alistipes sp.]
WSGTLLVDIWSGGVCGLNQHLFKVTSDKYPQWFIYYWTKHHLAKFVRIAKDKAVTMGHIKRGDLEASEVLIPNETTLNKMDSVIAPIFDAIISHRIENRTLATLRDTLLSKLMNGEIKI